LAEVEACIEGRPYETEDPGWLLGNALANSVAKDPECLRGFISIALLLERGVDVLSRPGLAEKAIALADDAPPPGPDRDEMLRLVGA
jgi:hypothetical protein